MKEPCCRWSGAMQLMGLATAKGACGSLGETRRWADSKKGLSVLTRDKLPPERSTRLDR
jgi:hypothetical protein